MQKKTARALIVAAIFALPLAACSTGPDTTAELPATRWDHHPEAVHWTASTLAAMRTDGAALLQAVPRDIEAYCPGYRTATAEERSAFWVGLFSSIAKYESTWNPRASGAGGRYLRLMQISPATARYVGCDAQGKELYDGAGNLSCAVKIAARKAPSAGVAGVVSDWGPMHDGRKRAEVAAWTRTQSYCKV